MRTFWPIGAGIFVLAHFFIVEPVSAQAGDVAEDMGGVDLSGKVIFERVVEKSYPVSGAGAALFVSNQFGAVRVSTWDNPVVKVEGVIRVGAENMMQAEGYAQLVAVEGNHIGSRVDVRTVFPKGRPGAGVTGYTVELRITVPREISLSIENRFGDCYVSNVGGDVTLDIGYGVIGLTNIGGVARVRAKGEFPLHVSGLPKGGVFFLRSSQALFSGVGGKLTVNNYLGTITIEKVAEAADVLVVCDNGPIHLTLPVGATPYLLASAEFGSIESDLVLRSQSWGRSSLGESGSQDSSQRIELRSSFDSVFIHIQSLAPLVEAPASGPTESVQETVRSTIPIASGKTLLVDAMEGDVILEGVDGIGQIEVEVTRFVRVEDTKNARLALEGLRWGYEDVEGELRVRTFLEEDLSGLGAREYRVDVRLKYPKMTPVRVVHSSGATVVLNAGGSVGIEQKSGDVNVVGSLGAVEVSSGDGDVLIEGNRGSVGVVSERVSIRAVGSLGEIRLEARRGKVVIEDPRGRVFARNTGGDIRIIALRGVFGEFDVKAMDGNISMVMAPDSDAWVSLNVVDGDLYSAIPVTGSHKKNTHTFQGRLNKATHRVVLETHRGNVVLD